MAHRLIFAASDTFINTKVKVVEKWQGSSGWKVVATQADGSFVIKKGINSRVYQVRSWEGSNECRATLMSTTEKGGVK